jgi:hypothetical protein
MDIDHVKIKMNKEEIDWEETRVFKIVLITTQFNYFIFINDIYIYGWEVQFEVAIKHTKSNVQLHLNKFTRYNPLNVKERVRLQIPHNELELEGN